MKRKKITFRNGSELEFFSPEKNCAGCKHFRESVKTDTGQGLCVLYSIVVLRENDCRFGFEAAHDKVQGMGTEAVDMYDGASE